MSDINPHKKRNFWRLSLFVLAFVAALIVALLFTARMAVKTEWARNYAERVVEGLNVRGQSIMIGDIEGDLLGSFSISKFGVHDDQGVWMEASGLSVKWNYKSLLVGKLNIELIEAATVDVKREPILTPPPSQTSQSGRSFIEAYEITTLNLPLLSVSEGITPQDITANLTASFAKTRNVLATKIQLSSEPSGLDTLDLSLDWPTNGDPSGRYSMLGKSGGLLATLARLPSEQTLSGRGAFGVRNDNNLFGDASLSIGDQVAFRAEITEASGAVSLKVDIVPSAHPLSRPYADYLEDHIELQASALQSSPFETLKATVVSGRNKLNLVMSKKDEINLKAQLFHPHRLMGSPPAMVEEFTLEGVIGISDTPYFEGLVDVQSIRQSDIELGRLTGPIVVKKDRNIVSTQFDLAASTVRVDGQAKVPENFQIKLSGDYDLESSQVRFDAMNVSSEGLFLTANGRISAATPLTANIIGTARVRGAVIGIQQLEQATSKWTLRRTANGLSTVDLSGVFRMTEVPELSDDPIGFNGQIKHYPDGRIALPKVNINQGDRTISLRARRGENGRISAEVTGTVPNVAIGDFASFNTQADFVLALDMGELSAKGYLTSDKFSAGGQVLDDLRIDFTDARRAGDRVSTLLQMQASYLEAPLTVNTNIAGSVKEQEALFEHFSAEWGALSATGSAVIPFKALEEMTANFELAGTDKKLGLFEKANAKLKIDDQKISGVAMLAGIEFADMRNGSIETRFEGDFSQVNLTADIAGEYKLLDRAVPIAYNGSIHILNILGADRLAQIGGTGSFGLLDIKILDTAEVSISPEFGLLFDAKFELAGGDMGLKLRPSNTGRLQFNAEGLQLSPFLQLAGQLPRAGEADFVFDLDADANGYLIGQSSLGLRGLQELSGKVSDFALNAGIQVQSSELEITLAETGLEQLLFSAKARLPLSIKSQMLQPEYDTSTDITFELKSNGQIGPLSDLFLPANSALDGNSDISLTGEIGQNKRVINGRLAIEDGAFEQADIGLNLVDIQIGAQIGGNRVTLDTFKANGASGGALSGGGQFQIGDFATVSSQIKVDKLVVFERPEARAVTSGSLAFGSDGRRPILTGALFLNEASINLEKIPSAGPPTLDITFKENVELEKSTERFGFFGVDITVRSERGVRITGRGVDAIVGLDLAIKDELVSPNIVGSARIVRGIFELLGKRFEITPSVLTFAEPLNETELNIEAVRAADGYSYSVKVLGTIARPEIDLSSDPTLPEDEILSRVLFGRSPSQLSGLEAARLAGALVQLNGGGGFDLLGGIEAQLGLDRLTIDSDVNGASALTTGKYLSDDVYVEVRTGATGAPGLSVEWQALDNLDVEAETVPGEGQTLSVKWKKDFD